MKNSIQLGDPRDPTRAESPISVIPTPATRTEIRRSPASDQVGATPNGIFNK